MSLTSYPQNLWNAKDTFFRYKNKSIQEYQHSSHE